MAVRTYTELTDDVDGSTATSTITFGLDGVEYEIDLGDENSEKLHADLAPWIAAARRVGGRRKTKTVDRNSGDLAAIRAWGRANGYKVSARGRISAGLRKAYHDSL